jgi:DUF1680 family protein
LLLAYRFTTAVINREAAHELFRRSFSTSVLVHGGILCRCLGFNSLLDWHLKNGAAISELFSTNTNLISSMGVMVLHHRGGAFEVSSAEEALYAPAKATRPKVRPEDLTLIPYYAWSNRQESAMEVWVPWVRV